MLYYKGVSVVGAGRAAIFMNLIPFLVIGLSWFFLGERVYWYHLVGATAAIGGVALATSKSIPPRRDYPAWTPRLLAFPALFPTDWFRDGPRAALAR